MNRKQFETQNVERWRELEALLDELEEKKARPEAAERLPHLFRQVCGDLALAEQRLYGLDLRDRLNGLVIRGYKTVYRAAGGGAQSFMRFFLVDFPRAVRRDWRLFVICSALFWVPFTAFVLSAKIAPEWHEAMLGPEQMAAMEMMYGHGSDLSAYRREKGSDVMMFGFYIMNNVGIDFRIFAGGMLACVGTIFFVVYNGLAIGASAAYVHAALDVEKFYCFVAGHSSWELIGMVIAGMAGMRVGLAILQPRQMTRRAALEDAGRKAVVLLLGAAAMTGVAAVIEAFWSAKTMVPLLKYSVGIFFWLLLAVYFMLCGRGRIEA